MTSFQKNPVLIALVGLAGTGKSEAGEVLLEMGYQIVYFGGTVLEQVQKRGMPITPENERVVREELRAQHGMAAMALLRLPEIKALLAAGRLVAIDGLYSFAEYELLKANFGNQLKVLAIHAPKALRYARLAARKLRPLTALQVDERDFFEIKNLDKGGPIAIADAHIINEGSACELHEKVRQTIKQLASQ